MQHHDDSVFESGIENLYRFQRLFTVAITASCLFNDDTAYLSYFIVYSSLYLCDKILFMYFEKPGFLHFIADLFDIGLFFKYKNNVFIKLIIRIILIQYIMICLVLSRDSYYNEKNHSIQICFLFSFILHLIIITARINVIFAFEKNDNQLEDSINEFQEQQQQDECYQSNQSSSSNNQHDLFQQLIQNDQYSIQTEQQYIKSDQKLIQINQQQLVQHEFQDQLNQQQFQVIESTSQLPSVVTKPLIKHKNKTQSINIQRIKRNLPSFRSVVSFFGRLGYQICIQLLLVLLLKQSFIRSIIYIISKMLISFILNRIVLYYQQGPTLNYLVLILAQFFYIVIDHGPFYQFFMSPYTVNKNERLLYSSFLFKINSLYQLVDATSIFLMDYMINSLDIAGDTDLSTNKYHSRESLYDEILYNIRATSYIMLGFYQLCFLLNISTHIYSYCTNRYRIYSSISTSLKNVLNILQNSSQIIYLYGNLQTSNTQDFFNDDQSSLIYNEERNHNQSLSSTIDNFNNNNNREQTKGKKIQKRQIKLVSFREFFKKFIRKTYSPTAYIEIQQDFNTLMFFQNEQMMFDQRFHKVFLDELLFQPNLPYSQYQYINIDNDGSFLLKQQAIQLALNIRFIKFGMEKIQIQMNLSTTLTMKNLISPLLLQIFTYYSLISKNLSYNPHIILYDLYF